MIPCYFRQMKSCDTSFAPSTFLHLEMDPCICTLGNTNTGTGLLSCHSSRHLVTFHIAPFNHAVLSRHNTRARTHTHSLTNLRRTVVVTATVVVVIIAVAITLVIWTSTMTLAFGRICLRIKALARLAIRELVLVAAFPAAISICKMLKSCMRS